LTGKNQNRCEKVKEELAEFEMEVKNKNQEKAGEEFGDILFSLINYARFLNINPEDALEQTNRKFIKRFSYMEQRVKEKGKEIADCKLAELDEFWNEAKNLK
jgi:XTP/dITP diphosphohydrolase